MNLPDYAGIKIHRRNRTTGTLVSLYDGDEQGFDTTGGKWSIVCEDHHTVMQFETRRLAEKHLSTSWDWCDDCRQILEQP